MVEFDLIVIGGGHAGCEAAYIASKMGLNVLLLTQNVSRVVAQSCNPAVGGVGKGHIVREIVALGGLMGRVTDATGIHFRTLNTRKGPAVRATRVQTDSAMYTNEMLKILWGEPRIVLGVGEVAEIVVEENAKGRKRVCGVKLSDETEIGARTVVVATGTFLKGKIHIGFKNFPAGRVGEPPSNLLSDSLKRLGLRIGRLKTGTCPRIDIRTVDFSKAQKQAPEHPPPLFTDCYNSPPLGQIDCYITATNKKTHEIILSALDRSPLFTGKIEGVGPRYCPSIEDKVVKFSDKPSHQIFLEPEGRNSTRLYLSGLSTSLPEDVQDAMIRTIPGLEDVKIIRWGYAVEYDFCHPTQLYPTLEVKTIEGLFHAGQINGTSGYEEAAGQGILAGINAGCHVLGRKKIVIRRDQGYIGVLVDDLTTKGTQEPYRMFTSRAEYRLLLREDNAFQRLGNISKSLGLLKEKHELVQVDREKRTKEILLFLKGKKGSLQVDKKIIELLNELSSRQIHDDDRIIDIIKREGIGARTVLSLFGLQGELDRRLLDRIDAEIRYDGYIQKEIKRAERLKTIESVKIPPGFSFRSISGISKEVAEKLERMSPPTLGHASRISGVTPAAISLLWIMLRKSAGANETNCNKAE